VTYSQKGVQVSITIQVSQRHLVDAGIRIECGESNKPSGYKQSRNTQYKQEQRADKEMGT
jgi:hypothetical protein